MASDTPTIRSARQKLVELMSGPLYAQALYVVAELGIADHLRAGPQLASELAVEVHTDSSATYRLLRCLAGLGVFEEGEDGRFALTPTGACLQSDAPGHARSMVRWLAGAINWRMIGELMQSVRTGDPSWNRVTGQDIDGYLQSHQQDNALVNEMLVGFHGEERSAVAAAYDFSWCKTLVDVGGGIGELLGTVLLATPNLRGVLCEVPHVLPQARAHLATRGVLERCELVAGNFFDSVPAGHDCYLLSHVIHDWDEQRCLTILGNCRRAIASRGRLLLVEMLIPTDNKFHPVHWVDLQMLLFTGGRERTEREYAELLRQAGFRLVRVAPTNSAVSVLEAVPDAATVSAETMT